MGEIVRVALDAMGGDYAPKEIVKGALMALQQNDNLQITLVGNEQLIQAELANQTYNKDKLAILDAKEVISLHESPVLAIRRKKESSMVKGMKMLVDQEADAFVSAGSTGALLAGGTFIVGRIKGVERPALAPLIPTKGGVSLLIDCGANVDAKPQYLVQFAKMGSIYYENIIGKGSPRVGLINIGEEAEKGNALVKETYPLLQAETNLHFIGNVEARDIPNGVADILVCDAFVGNVILKYTEGFATSLLDMIKEAIMSTTRSKIGGMLIKPALKKMLKTFDYTEYGGAPLLGLEGLIVKVHGNADSITVKNAIVQCIKFKQQKINEKIRKNL